jgi:hypothetical protein
MGFEIRADRGKNQGRAGLPGERAARQPAMRWQSQASESGYR